MTNSETIEYITKLYFEQPSNGGEAVNPVLYKHLFDSFHQFIDEMIPYSLINDSNIFYENIEEKDVFRYGLKFSDIRIKPPTFDNDNEMLLPKDARKNHLNYFGTVVSNVEQYQEITNILTGQKNL